MKELEQHEIDATIYRGGLGPVAASGALVATGDNILCVAILPTDSYGDVGQTLMEGASLDVLGALCFRIVDTGPDVDREKFPVGFDCIHTSAAADALDWTDKGNRYCCVKAKHIPLIWDPDTVRMHVEAEESRALAAANERFS